LNFSREGVDGNVNSHAFWSLTDHCLARIPDQTPFYSCTSGHRFPLESRSKGTAVNEQKKKADD
jgi:hypothetical protein